MKTDTTDAVRGKYAQAFRDGVDVIVHGREGDRHYRVQRDAGTNMLHWRQTASNAALATTDPLTGFNWTTLYPRYDRLNMRYATQARKSPIVPEVCRSEHSDRALYRWLTVEGRPGPKTSVEEALAWYQAVLFWKLYSQPAALSNLHKSWFAEEPLTNHHQGLLGLIALANQPEPQSVDEIMRGITAFDACGLPGSKNSCSLPVRSTVLHILFPRTVPIIDKQVLAALGVMEKTANQSHAQYVKLIEQVRVLADRHGSVGKTLGYQETPIRLIDMGLWVIRGSGG